MIGNRPFWPGLVLLCVSSLLQASEREDQVIPVVRMLQAPMVDGSGADWVAIRATQVRLKSIDPARAPQHVPVEVKAGVYAGRVYFWLSWRDDKPGMHSNPWAREVLLGPEQPVTVHEDRLTLAFEADRQATDGWMAEWSLEEDIWHWKSSRSIPAGVVHDKSAVISHEFTALAAIRRQRAAESDLRHAGLQRSATPGAARFHADVLPRYELGDRIAGSIRDVDSAATWSQGRWQVELSRAIDTGHADDLSFHPLRAIFGRLGVSSSREMPGYAESVRLVFDFRGGDG